MAFSDWGRVECNYADSILDLRLDEIKRNYNLSRNILRRKKQKLFLGLSALGLGTLLGAGYKSIDSCIYDKCSYVDVNDDYYEDSYSSLYLADSEKSIQRNRKETIGNSTISDFASMQSSLLFGDNTTSIDLDYTYREDISSNYNCRVYEVGEPNSNFFGLFGYDQNVKTYYYSGEVNEDNFYSKFYDCAALKNKGDLVKKESYTNSGSTLDELEEQYYKVNFRVNSTIRSVYGRELNVNELGLLIGDYLILISLSCIILSKLFDSINSSGAKEKEIQLLQFHTNELKDMIKWMDTQASNETVNQSCFDRYFNDRDKYLDIIGEAESFISNFNKSSDDESTYSFDGVVPVFRKIKM